MVLVTFTLYGIDGIARQLEDPFGRDRNDIKVDGLVEDVREEVEALVAEWKRVVFKEEDMFSTTAAGVKRSGYGLPASGGPGAFVVGESGRELV